MPDPRRQAVLALILEWDHTTHTLPDHLGMTEEQWLAFRSTGAISPDYQPREPREPEEPDMPHVRPPGRPPGCKVPPETKDRIRQRLLEGMPRNAIAGECGVSLNMILGVARKLKDAKS